MAYDRNFLGKNGFIHFVGVCEDRQDPMKLGRLRVRCLGIHTDNKTDLPTADLPWAFCSMASSECGISGLGQSPSFIVEGAWVYGYFRDGEDMQEAVVMGVLPGHPIEHGNPLKGFYDPNPRENDEEKSVYPREINESDVNRLARNDVDMEAASLTARKEARRTVLATADFNSSSAADGSSISASDGDLWDQPEIPYNAVYPYNHVFESESGHIREYDDSFIIDENGNRINHYRIHERHTSGTGYEIDNAGNKVDLIVGDHYTILSGKRQAQIDGNSDVTINGRHKLYINKNGQSGNNYDIQVGPNANVNIQVDTGNINLVTNQGKINVNSGGDYNVKVGGNYTLAVAGNKSESVNGNKTSDTTGNVIHRGKRIDLNP